MTPSAFPPHHMDMVPSAVHGCGDPAVQGDPESPPNRKVAEVGSIFISVYEKINQSV